MKTAFLMTAILLGSSMTAFAQKIAKNEANQLKAFLTQSAEKEGTNAHALKVTDINNPGSIEGITVENGHVTAIEWKDKKVAGSLDVSGFKALKKLDVSRNALTALDASDCPALSELNARETSSPRPISPDARTFTRWTSTRTDSPNFHSKVWWW